MAIMFSKLLASLILKSAVIMWERKNNQQQEMAVRETIKNIKNNFINRNSVFNNTNYIKYLFIFSFRNTTI